MTSCLRPMLLAPPEAFAGGGVPPPADYLAAVLDATLPGVDANDSHKTLGTVRLYASVVSNFGALADPGEDGACDAFPFFWSDWIPALFDRFFAFFRNVDPGNASKSDGADKHRGGAGGDGGASYLMGTSSMYSPLMRLIFARASQASAEGGPSARAVRAHQHPQRPHRRGWADGDGGGDAGSGGGGAQPDGPVASRVGRGDGRRRQVGRRRRCGGAPDRLTDERGEAQVAHRVARHARCTRAGRGLSRFHPMCPPSFGPCSSSASPESRFDSRRWPRIYPRCCAAL